MESKLTQKKEELKKFIKEYPTKNCDCQRCENCIDYELGLQSKVELDGIQFAEDACRDEFIKFLQLILESNKGRADCLIHMVTGRLVKLKAEIQKQKEKK